MRKLFFAGALLSSLGALSCDVCGCATMGFGFDDLLVSNRHSIGLRYGLRRFTAPGLSDYYHQVELNGLYSFSPKWQIKANLPYLLAQRQDAGNGSAHLAGMGDATVRLRYIPFYKISEKAVQSIMVGVGVNAPSGKFEDREGSLLSPNFQTGSGSWDFIAESQYQISYKKWRIGIQAVYVFNNKNPAGYTFGDQAIGQLSAGYSFELKEKLALVPSLALSYEHFARDVSSRNYYKHGTGGQALNALAGISLITTDWYFSMKGGSNVFNETAGTYQLATQAQLSINYLF